MTGGPQLVWMKMSYMRYSTEGLGGPCLEVVRRGLAGGWRVIVFGNPFACARSFATWAEAAVTAELIAAEYAERTLKALVPDLHTRTR